MKRSTFLTGLTASLAGLLLLGESPKVEAADTGLPSPYVLQVNDSNFSEEVRNYDGGMLILWYSSGAHGENEPIHRNMKELFDWTAQEFAGEVGPEGEPVLFASYDMQQLISEGLRGMEIMPHLQRRYSLPEAEAGPFTVMYKAAKSFPYLEARKVDQFIGGFNSTSERTDLTWQDRMEKWVRTNLTEPNDEWAYRFENPDNMKAGTYNVNLHKVELN